MTDSIRSLHALGQSLWYDNIERRLLNNGEMAAMIARGEIRGVTSNPSIFHNAIAKTSDYDSALIPMAWAGWSADQIFWQLAVEDIRAACDLFLPLYQQTKGGDGYVSLEVNPTLAHDSAATLAQAIHLNQWVSRPNLMVKIPATEQGLPAIRKAIAVGVNINVTLIFSLERYRQVMDAYLCGLEDRFDAGLPLGGIASVASFFVSRIDSKVDKMLGRAYGKTAIANARLAYQKFCDVFGSARFTRLQAAGANLQRPLWASTSTKNPAYSDTLYVDNLIGDHSVNTVPPQTLVAFGNHGKARPTIEENLADARQTFTDLAAWGISMEQVTQELEDEGVKSFADAFLAMMETIESRRKAAAAELGPLAVSTAEKVAQLEKDSAPARIWQHDPALWTADPIGQAEIRQRLGWLTLPNAAPGPYLAFAEEIRSAGFDHALLLGMGGSSLAPEVLSRNFEIRNYKFEILDSTDPAQILAAEGRFPARKTLYIVSSKSGGTTEVSTLFDYFWARSQKELGNNAGEHFVAITDPGTSLEKLARQRGFRRVFNADPTVGGRYSALTAFGLAPAALMGIDLPRLLGNAAKMMAQCSPETPAARNPGLVLGAIMGAAALQGRDKLTILADQPLQSIGSWLEQLVAESSGKEGKGIVPIDIEPTTAAERYSPDRLFVYLRKDGDLDTLAASLRQNGHPVLSLPVSDVYELGAEFYRWEYAVAVACVVLGVNAFDQPDVQDAKDRTKAKIAEFRATYRLAGGIAVGADEAPAAVAALLAQRKPGDYLAINAYLPRNARTLEQLQRLRAHLQQNTGLPTTLGFGPRFLHSTGQLHKGGADNGIFLQITADPAQDVDIPGQGMTFGVLERAQALGDFEALQARGRRALRVHLPSLEALEAVISNQ